MESSPASKVGHLPVKQQLGFTVKDAGFQLAHPFSPVTIQEASSAEESGETESWALPARWIPPSSQGPSEQDASATSSDQPTDTGFKGFKDCCEAGSFTLAGAQALYENGRLEVVGTAHTCAGVRSLVKSVVAGLRAWQDPEPSSEGLGGTYFFKDEIGSMAAIVKPCDEEPLAPNNPKGFVGRKLGEPGLKPTVRVGEAAMREVAAFLLDYNHFAHVPHTVLVRVTHNIFHVASGQSKSSSDSPASGMSCSQGSEASSFSNQMASTVHPHSVTGPSPPSKLASLQEFIQHNSDASEMGCSRFSVKDVHRIGILDLRLFNTDRHAGNMLVREVPAAKKTSADTWLDSQLELIPIDHGFCLPEALEPPYLEWLHWPQAAIPFDDEELEYISRLDAAADADFLRQELPWLPLGSLRTLQVATLLLTKCAAAGLTLAEIGLVASRQLVGMQEEPSQLESICLAARAAVDAATEEFDSDSSECDMADEELQSQTRKLSLSGNLALGELGRSSFVMGIQVPLQTTMSGDELLFDLDDDVTSDRLSPPSRRPALSGQLQQPAGRRQGGVRQVASEAVLQTEASRAAADAAAAPAGGAARSLATGMLHRGAQRLRNRQYRSGAALKPKPSPPRGRGQRQAYPPPIAGAAPGGLNGVFQGLEKTAWAAFMQELELLIEEALDCGAWKTQPDKSCKGKAGLGVSCPRF